jgi:bilirubin oxidase
MRFLKTFFQKVFLKNCCQIIALYLTISVNAQNKLNIPDTLSGMKFDLELKAQTKEIYKNKQTQTIGYNGSYLGPTLMVQKGEIITMNVKNSLSDTTTTHWHGLHIAAKNDGGPHSHIMAGETWSPSFEIMDNAGTYWYHPHLHGKTLKQVVKGAAGLIIVRDEKEAKLSLPRTYGIDDIPLVFQFTTIDANKQIVENDDLDNTILVNGTDAPFVDLPAQVVRLRLLNASSHRVFRFGFSDGRNFFQIATDGGLLNAPISMTRLTLGSGERAEILVDLSDLKDKTITMKTFGNELPQGYPGGPPLGMMGGTIMQGPLDNITSNILIINGKEKTSHPITTIPTALVQNTVLSQTGAKNRTISITASPMMSMTNFLINGKKYDEYKMDFEVTEGDTEIWTITNQSMMAHPFHIHGNSFYVLSINGAAPAANLKGKKDVILVPPMNGSVKIITKYEDFSDSDMPYMYHCHILSHEDNGMMGQFIVKAKTTAANDIFSNDNLKIFPNPITENQLNIVAKQPIEQVQIIDALGRILLSKTPNQTHVLIDFPDQKGIYLVSLRFNGKILTKKVTR